MNFEKTHLAACAENSTLCNSRFKNLFCSTSQRIKLIVLHWWVTVQIIPFAPHPLHQISLLLTLSLQLFPGFVKGKGKGKGVCRNCSSR